MKFNKKIFLVMVFFSITFFAFSHPHLFMSSKEKFVFNDNKLHGCWIEWTFDSYFSSDIIYSYDSDKNGIFDAAETKLVYNNAFINLRNYYYFIFIRQGNKRTNPKKVYNFSARQDNGYLVYKFYIDLSNYGGNDLYLAVYDYTFFCDIRYPEDSVKFSYDKSKLSVSYSIQENTDYPVYYDPYGAATDTSIYYKWRKGLEIYYPKEIHIKYKQNE